MGEPSTQPISVRCRNCGQFYEQRGRAKGRKHRWRTTYFPHDPPFRQCKRCGQRQRLRLADPPDDYWFWLNLPNPEKS